MAGEDDDPVDRPEDVPEQQSAVATPRERRARESKVNKQLREEREWFQAAIASPSGRKFLWGILNASGAFEERYGFGPHGHPNSEATWSYAGQKDFGLRLYHAWSVMDRAGVLSLLDEFHPLFPKPKGRS
jgi:hypothetical protein